MLTSIKRKTKLVCICQKSHKFDTLFKGIVKSSDKRHNKLWMVVAQDVVISLLASLLSILLARWVFDAVPGFAGIVAKWMCCSLVATLAGIYISGNYKDILRFTTVRTIGKTVFAVIVKEVLLSVVFLIGFIRLPLAGYSILTILADLILTISALSYIRISARLWGSHDSDIKKLASNRTALLMGTDESAIKLASMLERENYSVVGLVTHDKDMSGRVIADKVVFYCENESDLEQLMWRLGGVDCIFFPHGCVAPAMGGGTRTIENQQDGMSFVGHVVKRSFDIILSGLLLLIFSPLIAICAIMVKAEDGGPVIYAQERLGRHGKPFKIYKFRSMRVDAERGTPALYSGEEDPRLTRTGRFLRAHHLDELPQLWNVFKGDMSFIGYRPERRFYIDQIMARNPRYRFLYQIRPGVTSYATLYNGYTDTMDKMLTRLDLDLYYLRNHSLWFDTKVLGLTFLSIMIGKKF